MDQHGITTRHHKSRHDITIKFQKSHSVLAQGLAVSDNSDVASLCCRAVGSEKGTVCAVQVQLSTLLNWLLKLAFHVDWLRDDLCSYYLEKFQEWP